MRFIERAEKRIHFSEFFFSDNKPVQVKATFTKKTDYFIQYLLQLFIKRK